MSASRLSVRYAKALLGLAVEQNQLEELTADVRQLEAMVEGSSELRMLLRSPIIQPSKKRPMLEMVFKDRFHSLLWNFIDVLLRKHREMHLVDMGKAFLDLYNQRKNITRVNIATASPVGDDTLQAIADSLRSDDGGTIEMTSEVDEDLIGGYVIQYGGQRYDASVARPSGETHTASKPGPPFREEPPW
jgi:F-type H+-transporting ATPase subunit delta